MRIELTNKRFADLQHGEGNVCGMNVYVGDEFEKRQFQGRSTQGMRHK